MGAPRHVAALAVVAALLPLAACGDDPASEPRDIGAVVAARTDIDPGDHPKTHLLLPSGRLDVRSGEPVEELSRDDTRERRSQSAPADGVFVPVTWTYRPGAMKDFSSVFGRPETMEVTLVSDGQRYRIAAPVEDSDGEVTESFYVAVEGTADDVELEVEYAGVTQTLDLVSGKRRAGRAEQLYRLGDYTPTTSPCPSEDWLREGSEVQVNFACTATKPLSVPFVDGTWVRAGHSFVVVGLSANLTAYTILNGTEGGATYTVTAGRDKSELDGRRATMVLDESNRGAVYGGYLVFEIKGDLPGSMAFRHTYQLQQSGVRGEIDAPDQLDFEIEGRLPLG